MGNYESKNENKEHAEIALKKIKLIQRIWRLYQHNKSKIKKTEDISKSILGIEIANLDPETLTTKSVIETEKRLGPFSILPNNSHADKELIYKQIIYHNNTVYQGTLNQLTFQKEGIGTLYEEDQSKYIGEFKNDKFNGIGRLLFSDGSYYEGMFKDGKQNGYGKYEYDNYTYIGNWVNDLKEGKGEEQFKDGTLFKGNFQKDQKNGLGHLIYPNGKSIEGYFHCDDEISGLVRMITEDNEKVSIGQWRNGVMNGVNLFHWNNNQKYIGEYKNFVKNGFGIFYWNDNSIYQGYWINGKQHGFGILMESIEDSKWDIGLYEWRYGMEINKIIENSEKYNIIKREIQNQVNKLNIFCKEHFSIDGIQDELFYDKIMNYSFKE